MNAWLSKVIQALLVIVLLAAAVRLAWELLRPAAPALLVVLAVLVAIRFVLGRSKGW